MKTFNLIKILFHHSITFNNFQSDDGSDYRTRKIPFTFRISHKEKDFRELALIHPINQLKLVQFYINS
jgi:hypothetical protein